jgi:hypothetical protein
MPALLIPVAPGVAVSARLHRAARSRATLLFFHGNGEIAADYDDLAPFFTRMGLNFFAADYRGYGRSDGRPTVAAMMQDAHAVLDFVWKWLAANAFTGPLIVMGRSLGSAAAIELAAAHPERVAGLIVESGFAFAAPLLRLLGAGPPAGFREERAFDHLGKIGRVRRPTLVIHAERDHLIPFADGRALYEAAGATDKRLLNIPGADHNDLFARGLHDYLRAVGELVAVCRGAGGAGAPRPPPVSRPGRGARRHRPTGRPPGRPGAGSQKSPSRT